MAFSFEWCPASQNYTHGDSPSFSMAYIAAGEVDAGAVSTYAINNTPAFIYTPAGTLWRTGVQVEENGFANYTVTATYGPRKSEVGSYTWSFDTTGATVKMKAAKQHIKSYDSGGVADPPDPHHGSIGVKEDGDVEGCDVIIPALKLNVQFRHPEGAVTIAYAKTLASYTGQTNSSSFLGFDAGELLYLGSTGSDGSEAEMEVTYQFAASQNVSSLSIGDITGIVKQGHHYAWVEFEDGVDDGQAQRKPKRVHIERVYDSCDFASVFGWS